MASISQFLYHTKNAHLYASISEFLYQGRAEGRANGAKEQGL